MSSETIIIPIKLPVYKEDHGTHSFSPDCYHADSEKKSQLDCVSGEGNSRNL